MKRRQFLHQLGSGALFLGTSGMLRMGWADTIGLPPVPTHFFVMLNTSGGLDATLGLDPQIRAADVDEKDLFLEYRPEDIVLAGKLRLGPAAVALASHANRCAVINGVMMRRDVGHPSLNRYMSTGSGNGRGATAAVELAASFGSGPYGTIINEAVYTANRAVILSAVADIKDAANQFDPVPILERMGIPTDGTNLQRAAEAVLRAKASAVKMNEQLERFKAQNGGVPLTDQQIVASAFVAGAASQAHLRLQVVGNGNLDTHTDHEKEHLAAQKSIWDQVSAIFKLFSEIPFGEGSLFDATTFMVNTEFSRTPALNAALGKDHNPFTNSILLAGRGIQAGTYGASRVIPRHVSLSKEPTHIAAPFNYVEGRVTEIREGASFIFPENVIRTVAKVFGDPMDFTSVAKEVFPVPGIVKS